jgi:hypothetical protein
VPEPEHFSTRPGVGETIDRISPQLATLAMGGFSMVLAISSYSSTFSIFAWIDILLNVPLFFVCAWVTLEAKGKDYSTIPGFLISAIAAMLSVGHLIFTTTHPWMN